MPLTRREVESLPKKELHYFTCECGARLSRKKRKVHCWNCRLTWQVRKLFAFYKDEYGITILYF